MPKTRRLALILLVLGLGALAPASPQVSVAAPLAVAPGRQAADVLTRAEWVFTHATVVGYAHHRGTASRQVRRDGDACEADTDCSGFVSYALHLGAPAAYQALRRFDSTSRHPLARTYARFFDRLEPGRREHGWLRVTEWSRLQPGDVIAWERAPRANDYEHRGNSGHVMFVLRPPTAPVTESVGGRKIRYVSVYVLDSSSVSHFPPEVLPPLAHQSLRDGVGKGNVRLLLDDQGRAVGYWEGTWWGEGHKAIRRPSRSSRVRFARLVD